MTPMNAAFGVLPFLLCSIRRLRPGNYTKVIILSTLSFKEHV